MQQPLRHINRDHVAFLQQGDWSADGRFGRRVADHQAARAAAETPVCDQPDIAAQPLTVERRRDLQHFAHAGSADRTLVADDEHIAFDDLPVRDRFKGILLGIEDARRTGQRGRVYP